MRRKGLRKRRGPLRDLKKKHKKDRLKRLRERRRRLLLLRPKRSKQGRCRVTVRRAR
jgi:hypothetical protein